MNIFCMVNTRSSTEYTTNALRTFFKHTVLDDNDQFILIDNDNSYCKSVDEISDKIVKHTNSSPKSFAANANQGIVHALKHKANLFFLNNDIIFTKNWLSPLLEENDSVLTPMSNREVEYKTPSAYFPVATSLAAYSNAPQELTHLAEFHRSNNTGYMQVLTLPFFAVKIPYHVMRSVGYFDEAYGLGGGEDYDYCLRTYLKGFSVKYACKSFLLHFGGKSTWSGVESAEQQQKREEIFKSRFQHKWGMPLSRVIFMEEHELLEQDLVLRNYINEKQHAKIVKALMPKAPFLTHDDKASADQ